MHVIRPSNNKSNFEINGKFYKKEKKAGSGSYGDVFIAFSKYYGKVAIKVLANKYSKEGIDAVTLREVDIIRNLNHPNLVKCIEFQYKYQGRTSAYTC
jgi:serine/threonine protein kinase